MDCDASAYLDAANWFEQTYVQTIVEAQHHTKANVPCSSWSIYLLDGSLVPGSDEEDDLYLHADTSSDLFTRD